MKKEYVVLLGILIAAIDVPPTAAQSGLWTHHSYWHQSNGSAFDHNAWIVEIDSLVQHRMTCNVSWNGIGLVRNYPGDTGHIGTLSNNITVTVPAYRGSGAAVVYRIPIGGLRPGGFSETTICN